MNRDLASEQNAGFNEQSIEGKTYKVGRPEQSDNLIKELELELKYLEELAVETSVANTIMKRRVEEKKCQRGRNKLELSQALQQPVYQLPIT